MKTIIRKGYTACFVTLMAMAGAAPAAAEGTAVHDLRMLNEIEVKHNLNELEAVLRPRPDIDLTDTALVFNNALRHTTVVRCVAFGRNGHPLAKVRTIVPGNGLRFILASDLADGLDFIGSARCWARGKVVPSAFIVGPSMLTDAPAKAAFSRRDPVPVEPSTSSLTDVPVDVDARRLTATRIRFPTVVTY